MKRLVAIGALLLMVPVLASAQNADHPYRGQGYFFFGYGPGSSSYQNIKHVGGGGEGFLYKGLGFGAEAGYAWGGDNNAWIASGDAFYHLQRHAARGGVDPFVLGGVSFVGPTSGRGSPAWNFGGGFNLWVAEHTALRFELREIVDTTDYWQHSYLSFRVGVTFR